MNKKEKIYTARLYSLLDLLRRKSAKQRYVTLGDIAHAAGLSLRQVRNYAADLEALGVIQKETRTIYKINVEILERLDSNKSEFQQSLDEILSVAFYNRLREEKSTFAPVTTKIDSVLEKVNLPLVEGDNLRQKLISCNPSSIRIDDEFLGESFLLPKFAERSLISCSVAGSSAKNRQHFIAFRWLTALSVGCYSACGWKTNYNQGFRDRDSDVVIRKPKIEARYADEDPFHEFYTEFPALREAGRRIAARYLMEGLHYTLDIELLRECGGEIDYYFRNGSIVPPHGFLVECKELMDLKRDVERLRQEFLNEARKQHIRVVGVVLKPEDDYYSSTIMRNVLLKDSKILVKDLWFLLGVLREADATCLIKRGREKGREWYDNYYEFYLRCDNWIMRLDFFSEGDEPLSLQKEIADIAYSLKTPYPGKSSPVLPETYPFDAPFVAPSPVVYTDIVAYEYLLDLEKVILGAIEEGIRTRIPRRVRG
jgi:hypothetical protein